MKKKSYLEMSTVEWMEWAYGIKLHWWQRLELRLSLRWESMKKSNSHLHPHVLYESIIKGRF